MATLIGVGEWDGTSWPSGAQPGDLGLVVVVGAGRTDSPGPGWALKGSFSQRDTQTSLFGVRVSLQVFERSLTAADLSGPAPAPGAFGQSVGQVWVVRGSQGVGSVRTGVRSV